MSGKVRLKSNGILDEDPLTLQDIVYRYICKNLPVISCADEDIESDGEKRYHLRDGIVLPNDICDRLIDTYQKHFYQKFGDKFISLFRDINRTSLNVVHLRNSNLTNYGKYFQITQMSCIIIAHGHKRLIFLTVNSHINETRWDGSIGHLTWCVICCWK